MCLCLNLLVLQFLSQTQRSVPDPGPDTGPAYHPPYLMDRDIAVNCAPPPSATLDIELLPSPALDGAWQPESITDTPLKETSG